MTFSPRCLLLLTLLFAFACGPATQEREIYDLVAELPAAEALVEPALLEMAGPAAGAYLVGGFTRGSIDSTDNKPYIWGVGEASEMRLPLVARRDLELSFEVKPLDWEVAPAQHIKVLLNGTEVVDLEFWPGRRVHRVVLPAAAQQLGENRLRFEYRWSRSPQELFPGNTDSRQLAVAWYWLRLGAVGAAETSETATAPRGEDDLLVIPARSQVEYHLRLPAGAEFVAESWAVRGAAGGALEVAVHEEQGEALIVRPEPGSELRLPISVAKSDSLRLVRLALRAVPSDGTEPGSDVGTASVVLRRPRIVAQVAIDKKAEASTETVQVDSEPKPDLLVYLIDTLRADYLGVYGRDRGTSPRIDAFAAGATVFDNAQAQSSWTRASVASVFTGLWPAAHGANRRSDKLSTEALTLAELLGAAGYRTAGFVTNPNVTPAFGFEQGFDFYEYLGEEATASQVTARVLEWLDEDAKTSDDGRPLFLYVHTIDPHTPYFAPAELRRRFAPEVTTAAARVSSQTANDLQAGRIPMTEQALADLTSLYDAEVAAADVGFGELLDGLESRGLADGMAKILLSDHGEEFGEHGNFEHGKALHVESLRVPLIVQLPGQSEPARHAELVQHIDLLPTLLDLIDAPGPAGLEGQSLMPLLQAGGEQAEARIEGFTAPTHFAYLHLDGPPRMSVTEEGFKAIHRIDREQLRWPRLFDLAADPQELTETAAAHPLRIGYLAALSRGRLAEPGGLLAEEAVLDDELRDSLRALGYLE